MGDILQILNLEDSAIDAELIREKLLEHWPGCLVERVETESDFIQALEGGGINLILADYALPGFDGMSALSVARERFSDIPFIFVSGTLGEETAIDTLKSGATDYVLKHRLSRLAPAVRRALAEVRERAARRSMENQIMFSARQWAVSFDAMAYGVSIHGADRTVLNANRAICRMIGKTAEEVIGKKCFQVFHGMDSPIAGCPLETSMRSRQQEYMEVFEPFLNKWLAVSTSPVLDENGGVVTMVHTVHDITSQKKAEEERTLLEGQLRHAQKMEAIGTLAGGIAHDFNNLLNVIMGYGSIVMDGLGKDNPLGGQMNEVLAAAEKAAQLTNRLLLFSRKEMPEVKPVNVNELVVGIQKMLLRIIGEDIDLNMKIADKCLQVMADSAQIEQVLMNLATNARDAMPTGGTLTITAGVEEIGDAFIAACGYGKPGMFARITVSDTGCGMDCEVQKNIFEPFFTTKEIGKGTGLGLAISYGIVKQHGGYLKVSSQVGKGATFKLYLPLMDESALSPGMAEASAPVTGGNETVLVAEDDAAVRELTKIVLESFGYRVVLAMDGEDAIAQFAENREKIQLVILDLIMPKKSGQEVYEEISKMAPGIKTLFSSGYSGDMISRLKIDKKLNFIQKPFAPKVFLNKVRAVLDT